MILYIIRHAEPEPATGALTGKGKAQAEALAKRLSVMNIDKLYSSPLLRAKQTAEPFCKLSGKELNIEEWAREIGEERLTDFPDGVKKSVSLVQNTEYLNESNVNLPYNQAFECDYFKQSGMKNAVEYIEKNGDIFLGKLGYKRENGIYRVVEPNEDKIALFCHAAFSRAWISVLLHIPIHIMWAGFDYEYTGITAIEFKNNENGLTAPTCLCYSDFSHLYSEEFFCISEKGTEM